METCCCTAVSEMKRTPGKHKGEAVPPTQGSGRDLKMAWHLCVTRPVTVPPLQVHRYRDWTGGKNAIRSPRWRLRWQRGGSCGASCIGCRGTTTSCGSGAGCCRENGCCAPYRCGAGSVGARSERSSLEQSFPSAGGVFQAALGTAAWITAVTSAAALVCAPAVVEFRASAADNARAAPGSATPSVAVNTVLLL